MRKKTLALLLLCILCAGAAFAFIGFKAVRRIHLQERRVLVVTDDLFYRQVLKGNSLKSDDGYRLEYMVLDTRDLLSAKAEETFRKILANLVKEDTVLLLMSPVVSYHYVQYGGADFTSLHYKPVIVGFGAFADNSRFDFVYRIDTKNCFAYRQMFGAKVLFLYSSSTLEYKESMSHFEKWPNDRVIDYDMLSEKDAAGFNDIASQYNMLLTPGFKNMYTYLQDTKLPVYIVMPYTCNLFSNRQVRFIGPDITHVISNSLSRYNKQNGCVVEDVRWAMY